MDERIRYIKKIARNEEMYERLHTNTEYYGSYELAIHYIRHNPGITQDELTNKLGVDKALTTRIVKKLEADGIITRNNDELDKRKKRLFATSKVDSIKGIVVENENKYYDYILNSLTEEEKEEFLTLLSKVYIKSKHLRKSGGNIDEK